MIKHLNNRTYNWAKIYDYYEIENRDMYNNVANYQNDSHFIMLKNYIKINKLELDAFAEIGFGSGITLKKALKLFNECYGFDISPKNIDFSKKEFKKLGINNVSFLKRNILDFDIKL